MNHKDRVRSVQLFCAVVQSVRSHAVVRSAFNETLANLATQLYTPPPLPRLGDMDSLSQRIIEPTIIH